MPIRMTGLVSGLDTESIIKDLMKAQRTKSTKIENNITKLEWKQDKWKALNTKIYSLYTGSLSKIRFQGNFNTKKTSSSDEKKVEVKAGSSVPEGTHNIKVKSVASTQYITGTKINNDSNVTYDTKISGLKDAADMIGSNIRIMVGDEAPVNFEIKEETTVGEFVSALQDAGLNASFDVAQQRFFISSKKTGVDNAFSIWDDSAGEDLKKLGLCDILAVKDDANGTVEVQVSSGVAKTDPSDAIILYNGAEIKSSSNSITVNGMTITIKGVTGGLDNDDPSDDEVINVGVTKDTQAIYDMIKDFVKSYNEVLKEMNEAYDAATSRGYEPLTDEEKEAMTEEQIEKWENKIKDSLLRRDPILETVISSMRSVMGKSVSYDGKSYSLTSFGITSVDYSEKGLLHIDGNSEDILTASEDDKLMKALTENPDAVMEVFTELASELYGTMTDQMKSTSLSSALTFYNDKEMKNTIDDYKEDLSRLEDRLQVIENRYYKQFGAMEKMMSQLNSQSSYLSSLLGMGGQ